MDKIVKDLSTLFLLNCIRWALPAVIVHSDSAPLPPGRLLFVTGKLAAPLVSRTISAINQRLQTRHDVKVLGISVAALMNTDWIARKLGQHDVQAFDCIVLPGWCRGDLARLEQTLERPCVLGPKEIAEVVPLLEGKPRPQPELNRYDIEILAEINHAPRLSEQEVMSLAEGYRRDGADIIDVGCVPGEPSRRMADIVRLLKQSGFRVSVDSFDRGEVEACVAAGAELVLSCNTSNLDWARTLEVEWVAIPDRPDQLDSLISTASDLQENERSVRLDPILEPIGFGFAASLFRYFETRRLNATAAMMMGIGNLTELTEVDSAGINVLLAAICQELKIHSVLTTQVIPWCQSAVAEFDRARKLVKYALEEHVVPKRIGGGLVMLRDVQSAELGEAGLQELASQLRDPNYRIFVEQGQIHVMNRDGYWRGNDAYELFDEFYQNGPPLDAAHAFYLGYELSKAVTALTLGKQYRQDQALQWGFLTVPEPSAHERRRRERDGESE